MTGTGGARCVLLSIYYLPLYLYLFRPLVRLIFSGAVVPLKDTSLLSQN